MYKIAFVFGLLISSSAIAQRVDLDRFRFEVAYQRLPQEPIPFEQRTYDVSVDVGSPLETQLSASMLKDRLILYGWKRTGTNPTVKAQLVLEDVVERQAQLESRTESFRQSDGKTGSVTFYSMAVTYSVAGRATLNGPRTPVPLSEKEQEALQKKEEAVSSNRFLKNATLQKPAEPLATGPQEISFHRTYTIKTQEGTDAKLVSKDYQSKRLPLLSEQVKNFGENTVSHIKDLLNHTYGYRPVKEYEQLWILDAKSEEGATQIEAIQAVKAILAEMRADEPIENIKANLQPLISYFESLKSKYTSDDKAGRKMRYSAFYNLGKIYLLTDQPEKAIQEGEGLVANDYDTSDGKMIIREAEQLLSDFHRAKTRSRHQPTLQ